MPILNESPDNIKPRILFQLIKEYNHYIQEAFRKGCHKKDWVPLNVDEFFDTEFKLLPVKKVNHQVLDNKEAENNNKTFNSPAEHRKAGKWSTLSRHEVKGPRKRPWWLRWLT
ncbi:MAG: hypothetical protein H0Z40_03950 [Desulfotomaculum sp.]|nr:hypothetical protein [Desulfotomaculum sp.]